MVKRANVAIAIKSEVMLSDGFLGGKDEELTE